jgi:hypothetical protein
MPGRVRGGGLGQQLQAGGAVLHAGGGDQHDQQQPERVGDDVPLAADDLLPGVGALRGGGHGDSGLDALGVDDAGGGLGITPCSDPD